MGEDTEDVTGKCKHCSAITHDIQDCPFYNIVSRLAGYSESSEYSYRHYDLPIYDTHCHFDAVIERFGYKNLSLKEFMDGENFPVNFKGCISSFSDLATFSAFGISSELLDQDGIWGTFGLHPHNAQNFDERIKARLRELLQHKKAVAVGECGIDYSVRNDCPADIQKRVFIEHIKIAKEMEKPLVIHSRQAEDDVYDILCEENMFEWPIQIHCFTGCHSQLHRFVNQFSKMYFGFTNLVSYPTAENSHIVAKSIPLDRILLETDAPYFVPQNLRKKEKFSHPGNVLYVAETIAKLRNQDVEIILENCRRNIRKLYGI